MGSRDELGQRGEALAAGYLRRRGCVILQTRYRCREGEIDLIAEDGVYLCFVEVKLRKTAAYGSAAAFVDWRKQQRLRTAAELYLAGHPTGLQPRFDVAEVYVEKGGILRVEYLEDAFR